MPITKLNSSSLSSAIEMISTKDIFRLLGMVRAKDPNYANLINLLITAIFIRYKTLYDLRNQLAYLDHLDAEKWENFNLIFENKLVKSALKYSCESRIATPEYIYTLLYTWYLRDLSFQTNTVPNPDLLASLSSQTDLKLNLVSFALLPNIVIKSQNISKIIDLLLPLLGHEDDLIRYAAILALESLARKIPQHDRLRVIDGLFVTLADKNYQIREAAEKALPKIFQYIQQDFESFIQYLLLKYHKIKPCSANCLEKMFSKLQNKTQLFPESLRSILNETNTPKIAIKMLKTLSLKLQPKSLQILFESILSSKLVYCWRETPQEIMDYVCLNSDIESQDVQELKKMILSKIDNSDYGAAAAIGTLYALSSKFESSDIQDLKRILVRKTKDTDAYVRKAAVVALAKLYLIRIPQQAQELTLHLQPIYTDPVVFVREEIISALEKLCFQLEITEVEAPIQGLLDLSTDSRNEVRIQSIQALLKVLALYPEKLYPRLYTRFPQFISTIWREVESTVEKLNPLFFSESLLNLLLSVIDHPNSLERQAATAFLREFLRKIQNIKPNIEYNVLSNSYRIHKPGDEQKLIDSSSSVVNRVRYQPDLFNILLIKLDTSPLEVLRDLIAALSSLSETAEPNDKRRFIKALLGIIDKTPYNPKASYLTDDSTPALKSAISALAYLSLEPKDEQILFKLLLAILQIPDPHYFMYDSILAALSNFSKKLSPEDAQELFDTLTPLLSTREITRFVKSLLILSTNFKPESRQILIDRCCSAIKRESSFEGIIQVLPSLSENIESSLVSKLLSPVIASLNDNNPYNRKYALEFLCHWMISHVIDHTLINIPTTHREAILFLAIYALRTKITFQAYILKSSIPILEQEYLEDTPYITQEEINTVLAHPSLEKHQRIINGFCSFFNIDAKDNDAPRKITDCLARYTL